MRVAKLLLLSFFAVAVAAGNGYAGRPTTFDFYEYMRKRQEASATPHEHFWIPATVRSIDPTNRQITIVHDPSAATEMPRMDMTFAVTDQVHLPMLRRGTRVEIQIDKHNGLVVVIGLRMRH